MSQPELQANGLVRVELSPPRHYKVKKYKKLPHENYVRRETERRNKIR